jgi:cytidylate kinase
MNAHLIIAIDGYSSCGKSTVAKEVARRLALQYIDSGAMYRAVTLYFLRHGLPIPAPTEVLHSPPELLAHLDRMHIHFRINPETGASEVYLNSENVEEDIRSMEVSDSVSQVSAIPEVRHRLVQLQQQAAEQHGIVMDGRDIGTTVFPDADLKIFMTADAQVRAERRFKELRSKGVKVDMQAVVKNVVERDHIDSHREVSPLRKAADAIVLDNTNLTREEQVDFVMEKVRELVLQNS